MDPLVAAVAWDMVLEAPTISLGPTSISKTIKPLTPDHAGRLKDMVVAHRPLVTPLMGACHDSLTQVREEATSAQEQEGESGRASDLELMPSLPYHPHVFITTMDASGTCMLTFIY